jgi:hypothetical protein
VTTGTIGQEFTSLYKICPKSSRNSAFLTVKQNAETPGNGTPLVHGKELPSSDKARISISIGSPTSTPFSIGDLTSNTKASCSQ